MTELVLETGAGLADANSYVSVEEADEYLASNRYFIAWEEYDTADKENLLIRSSLLLDAYVDWYGTKAVADSGLRWPRSGVYNMDGALYSDDAIPIQLKRAVAEFAFGFYAINPQADTSVSGLTELKVDVIELKFDKSDIRPFFTDGILVLLRGLGVPVSGMRSLKVGRS